MGQDTELVTIMTITRTLQLHIKHAYNLTDSRLRAYSPSEPLKSGEGIRLKDRLEPLDLSWVDLDAFANREGRVRQANLLFSFIETVAVVDENAHVKLFFGASFSFAKGTWTVTNSLLQLAGLLIRHAYVGFSEKHDTFTTRTHQHLPNI